MKTASHKLTPLRIVKLFIPTELAILHSVNGNLHPRKERLSTRFFRMGVITTIEYPFPSLGMPFPYEGCLGRASLRNVHRKGRNGDYF